MIKQKLNNFAKQNNQRLEDVIGLYVRESLLDRISRSEIGNKFVLKGASVFQVLQGQPHRPTKDIDLLGFGNNNPEAIKAIFTDICQIDLGDGVVFDKIETDILQKGKKYQGVRLNIKGNLEGLPINTQIDIGYGHIITPLFDSGMSLSMPIAGRLKSESDLTPRKYMNTQTSYKERTSSYFGRKANYFSFSCY